MRRRGLSGLSTPSSGKCESRPFRRAMTRLVTRPLTWVRSALFWTGMAVLLTLLVPACSGLQDEHPARGGMAGSAGDGLAGATRTAGANAAGEVLLRQHLREQARLWDVTYPMLSESVEVCRDRVRFNFGFVAWTRWDIDRRYRIASMGAFGLDDRLRVVHVLPGSPAAAAGLRAGDEIEWVGYHRMPTGKAAGAALELVLAREAAAGVAQSFRIRRGNARYRIEIVPRPQCDVELIVTDSGQVSAFNYGRSVYLTHGLMRILSDDLELAAVAAHFAGHGLLDHQPPGREESVSGTLHTQLDGLRWALMDEREKSEMRKVGDLPGTRPYSTEQEMHADRVALEFMARAGYPMEGLVEVWHRLVEADRGKLVLWRYHAPSQRRQGAVRDVLTQVRSEDRTGDAAPGS